MAEKGDEFYRQVSESIKLVFDLTSRIDERVKFLVEQHGEANDKIEKLMDRQEGIVSRLSVLENKNGNGLKEDVYDMKNLVRALEIKVASLEIHSASHTNKWSTATDFVFKVIVTAIGAMLAWKIGGK